MSNLTCDSNSIDISTFAFNIFAALASNEAFSQANILLSPISIASALALVLAGATIDSQCKTQIETLLSVVSHEEIPLLSSQILGTSCSSSRSSGVKLKMANSIWIDGSIRDDYKNIVSNIHDAQVSKLPSTYDTIDKWISDATDGLIKDMISGPVDPLVVALLVNAVHFKGSWKKQFNPERTFEGSFITFGGEKRKSKFMNAERNMNVAMDVESLGGATVVELDYGSAKEKEGNSNEDEAEFAFLAMLPKEDTISSLQNVISDLASSKKHLMSVMNTQMINKKVDLSLPRFKLSFGTKSLKGVLKQLGMIDAFEGKNVFDTISGDPDVHLDDVLHKAVMEVTEEGTIAAAATIGVMMTRSMPTPSIYLNFNRPFVVAIVHVNTGTPLFLGQVIDPEFEF